MKKLYTILPLLLLVSSTFAQNIFFVDYSIDFEAVLQEMEGRNCVEVQESFSDEYLLVSGMGAEVSYQFNEGNLYRIEMVRRFDNRRQAMRVFEESQVYFRSILAVTVGTPVLEKHYQHVLFGRTGRIYELEYKTLINKEIEIRLVSISTGNMPLHQAEHYGTPASVNMGEALSLTP